MVGKAGGVTGAGTTYNDTQMQEVQKRAVTRLLRRRRMRRADRYQVCHLLFAHVNDYLGLVKYDMF